MLKTIIINDKTYEIVKESGCYTCNGCAFYLDNKPTCNDEQSYICTDEQSIFVEVKDELQAKEQKYTIQELIATLSNLHYSTTGLEHLVTEAKLNQLKKDPEYEEFTRLKEKFKDVI